MQSEKEKAKRQKKAQVYDATSKAVVKVAMENAGLGYQRADYGACVIEIEKYISIAFFQSWRDGIEVNFKKSAVSSWAKKLPELLSVVAGGKIDVSAVREKAAELGLETGGKCYLSFNKDKTV